MTMKTKMTYYTIERGKSGCHSNFKGQGTCVAICLNAFNHFKQSTLKVRATETDRSIAFA